MYTSWESENQWIYSVVRALYNLFIEPMCLSGKLLDYYFARVYSELKRTELKKAEIGFKIGDWIEYHVCKVI